MEVKNLKHTKDGSVEMEINHPIHGWIPFNATENDPEEMGRVLYQEAIAGDLGTIEPFSESFAVVTPRKLSELKSMCENTIIGGFQSDAFAVGNWYKSDRDDQLNLIGAKDAPSDLLFPTGTKDTNGVITYVDELHTPAQLTQIFNDGLVHKYTQINKLKALKVDVQAIIDDQALPTPTMTEAEAVTAMETIVWN